MSVSHRGQLAAGSTHAQTPACQTSHACLLLGMIQLQLNPITRACVTVSTQRGGPQHQSKAMYLGAARWSKRHTRSRNWMRIPFLRSWTLSRPVKQYIYRRPFVNHPPRRLNSYLVTGTQRRLQLAYSTAQLEERAWTWSCRRWTGQKLSLASQLDSDYTASLNSQAGSITPTQSSSAWQNRCRAHTLMMMACARACPLIFGAPVWCKLARSPLGHFSTFQSRVFHLITYIHDMMMNVFKLSFRDHSPLFCGQ